MDFSFDLQKKVPSLLKVAPDKRTEPSAYLEAIGSVLYRIFIISH